MILKKNVTGMIKNFITHMNLLTYCHKQYVLCTQQIKYSTDLFTHINKIKTKLMNLAKINFMNHSNFIIFQKSYNQYFVNNIGIELLLTLKYHCIHFWSLQQSVDHITPHDYIMMYFEAQQFSG